MVWQMFRGTRMRICAADRLRGKQLKQNKKRREIEAAGV
jgi:hypothetical protein